MKSVKMILGIAALSTLAFTSCKKDYTCTCTTSVGSVSNTVTHDLNNQSYKDANEACDRFENQANSGGSLGTTNCHL